MFARRLLIYCAIILALRNCTKYALPLFYDVRRNIEMRVRHRCVCKRDVNERNPIVNCITQYREYWKSSDA